MTRVSFYILASHEWHQRQVYACRLAEKAYRQGQHVYIYTSGEQHSAQLSELLWSFRPDSFVPHDIQQANVQASSPVLIAHDELSPPRLMDFLINLSDEQPLFFSQFERVAEIIDNNEPIKQAGRQRYQFYKQRGYELDTFTI